MINNNLLLEIKKIHNLMDVNHNGLILENVTATKMFGLVKDLVSKFGDDIIKLTTKITKKDKSAFDSIINKLKSNTPLVDNEIQFLTRFVDWDRIAKNAMTDNRLIGQSFINGLDKAVRDIKKKPSLYKNELEYWTKFLETSLFNDIPDVVKTSLRKQIKERFKKAAGIVDDVTPGRIVPDNNIPIPKNNIKKIIDRIISKNLQTIQRIVRRGMSSQEKLNEEFLEVAKESAYALSQGKSGNYYYKKMSDILLSKKKSFDDGITEMYRVLSKDPTIPNEVKKQFSKSEFYNYITKNPETSIIKPWKNLLWPWSNKNIGEWIQRVFMFILNQNPMTLEEIVLNIQKSGLRGFLLQRAAAGYFAKFVFAPAVFGIIKSIAAIPVEAYRIGFDDEYINPWGPKGEQEWTDAIINNLMTGFGGINPSWMSLIPFGTLVDDMWVAAKKVNRFTHDLYKDDNTKLADEFINSENTSNVNNDIIKDAETFLKDNKYWSQGMTLTTTNNPDEVIWKTTTGETGTIKKQQDGTFK